MKTFFGFLFIIGSFVALLGIFAMNSSSDSGSTPLAPAVSMSRVVGTYLESKDQIKSVTIKEVYADTGWNGQLSFSPPVGDWARPVRCRVVGNDLAVEIPARSGTVVVKLFRLHDRQTIVGAVSPWEGTFHRVR